MKIGHLEEYILLSILPLSPVAYGISIRDKLINSGIRTSNGSVYTTLDRLYVKGLVRTRLGAPNKRPGGKAITYYEVADKGKDLLRKINSIRIELAGG